MRNEKDMSITGSFTRGDPCKVHGLQRGTENPCGAMQHHAVPATPLPKHKGNGGI